MGFPTDVIVAIIAAIPAVLAVIYARKASQHSKETNDAVNHRHEKGTPRLYDLALENRTGVMSLDRQVKEVKAHAESVESKLDAHILPVEECRLQGCLRREMAEAEEAATPEVE